MGAMAVRLLLVVALASCAAPAVDSEHAAITNGTADANDSAVAAILSLDGQVVCSGTLIAPHVVLTAAHCGIDETSFGQFLVSFGASASATGALSLSDAAAHPMFDPTTLDNDLGALDAGDGNDGSAGRARHAHAR